MVLISFHDFGHDIAQICLCHQLLLSGPWSFSPSSLSSFPSTSPTFTLIFIIFNLKGFHFPLIFKVVPFSFIRVFRY